MKSILAAVMITASSTLSVAPASATSVTLDPTDYQCEAEVTRPGDVDGGPPDDCVGPDTVDPTFLRSTAEPETEPTPPAPEA